MRVRKLLLLAGLLLLTNCFFSVFAAAEAGGLKITEMAVTTKIVKGNPIDSVRRISSSSVKALYCFTRLSASTDEDTVIKHVWYKDDVVVGEYELPVKGRHWRTYSRKMVEKAAAGDWRVEVLDSEGNILKTVKFRMN